VGSRLHRGVELGAEEGGLGLRGREPPAEVVALGAQGGALSAGLRRQVVHPQRDGVAWGPVAGRDPADASELLLGQGQGQWREQVRLRRGCVRLNRVDAAF
jgi:hypothetical protein